MSDEQRYSISTDVRFEGLNLIDIPALVRSCEDPWHNQTLTRVNDCVVRLGCIQGDFHWHRHDEQDEFFYLVQGRLSIDLEGRTVEVDVGQGFMVPRGILHRPRAPGGAVILMVEGCGVVPTGD